METWFYSLLNTLHLEQRWALGASEILCGMNECFTSLRSRRSSRWARRRLSLGLQPKAALFQAVSGVEVVSRPIPVPSKRWLPGFHMPHGWTGEVGVRRGFLLWCGEQTQASDNRVLLTSALRGLPCSVGLGKNSEPVLFNQKCPSRNYSN